MQARLNIAFRADAALHIGAGHIARCLTLANMLKEMGATTVFICREHDGHLGKKISEQGHELCLLPRPSQPVSKQPNSSLIPPHTSWLGESWERDLEQTIAALAGHHFDWLVVDVYGLDARWESGVRTVTDKVMVIDDLADRKHECEILLDQTFNRSAALYKKLVPESCTLLIGSNYALLRPEFSELRQESLERRAKPTLKRLLVNFGGMDGTNITGRVLEAIARCKVPELEVTVVMGGNSSALLEVEQQAREMPIPTTVIVDAKNMAEIMAESDLAIGAAGGTAWERCCLGLPSIMLITAENQQEIARALETSQAALICRDVNELNGMLQRVTSESLARLSHMSAKITEGRGAKLVVERLTGKQDI